MKSLAVLCPLRMEDQEGVEERDTEREGKGQFGSRGREEEGWISRKEEGSSEGKKSAYVKAQPLCQSTAQYSTVFANVMSTPEKPTRTPSGELRAKRMRARTLRIDSGMLRMAVGNEHELTHLESSSGEVRVDWGW